MNIYSTRHKKTVIAQAMVTAFCGAATVAYAQTPPPAPASQSLQRVEVTGSLIRRIDAETSLPVTIIRTEELQRAGVTNAEQAVQFISQQQGGRVTSGSVSGTNGGSSFADLRSLGAQRTLVLLNGRRVASNPYDTVAVDLNTLPLTAVERIETLSDGASSVYGTDAIAGVINFITRRNYKGLTVDAQTQMTQHGGGNVHTAGVLGGIGDYDRQGWNVYGSLGYRKQESMLGTERDFMRTSYLPSRGFDGTSPTTFPANYSQVVGGVTTVAAANPTSPGCAPEVGSISVPEANGTRVRCFADTQMYTNVVPLQEQINAYLRGNLALGDNHRGSLEYFRSTNKIVAQIAPSPEGGLAVAPDSPYYPGRGIYAAAPGLNATQPINVNWRTTAIGPRRSQQEGVTQRLMANVEGTFGEFDYNAALVRSQANVDGTFLSGWPTTQGLRNGLRGCVLTGSGAATNPCGPSLGLFLNPFGPQTAAGQAYLDANQVRGKVQESESTLTSAQLTVSRNFGSLAGGPVGVALTGEFRKEENLYLTDVPKVSQAASSGLAGQGARREGERDIQALGLEINLPVLKQLEVNLAVRTDKYSDFGSTTNPKISARWNPTNNLLVRGSYNTGFAAPSLTQLYAPNATTFTATRYNDPVLCPNGVVNTAAGGQAARDCGIQFQRLTGGNATLTPEKSDAFSLGFVLQATREWSFGVDYWNYHIKNAIGTLSETGVFADPNKYASLFIRCSQAPADRRALVPGCQQPGGDPLAYIINTNLNLGDYKTHGFDVQVNYAGAATPLGRFSASVRGSFVSKFEFQVEQGGRWFDPTGNYQADFGGPVLRYQQITTVGWERGEWSAQVTNRYISGYKDQNGSSVTNPAFRDNTVGAYSLWNLSAGWKPMKNLTLQAAVLNVFDTDPPYSNQASRFQARAYDDRFHNPLGRTFQLSGRYEF